MFTASILSASTDRFPSIRSNSSMVLIWSTWKLSPGWFSAALSRACVLSDSFLISDNIFSSLKRTLRWNPKYMENFWVYVEINGNIYRAYFRKGMRTIFQKKDKKRQNIWKFWQKCTNFENILKNGSLVSAIVARMKQLEYALL